MILLLLVVYLPTLSDEQMPTLKQDALWLASGFTEGSIAILVQELAPFLGIVQHLVSLLSTLTYGSH